MKVIVAGPSNSGKTSIANFLCGNTNQLGTRSKDYEPTEGVRILEQEVNGVEVEMWDVSGSQVRQLWRRFVFSNVIGNNECKRGVK